MMLDVNGFIQYTSPSVTRILGYASNELVGRNAFDLIFQDDLQQAKDLFARLVQSPGDSITAQVRYRHEDGSWRCLDCIGTNLLTEQSVNAIVGNFSDITEQKRAEKELQLLQNITLAIGETEDFHSALGIVLRKACETTGWNIGEAWIPDPDGTCLVCSPAWYSSAEGMEEFRRASKGFTFSPGIGLPGRAWSSKEAVWSQDVTLDTNFPRGSFALKAGIKAGVAIPVLLFNDVIAVLVFFVFDPREEDKRFINLITAVASQIGSVMQRKKAEEALQKNYNLLNAVIEGTTDAVFVKDLNGCYLMINPPGARLIGRSVEEVIGKDDIELFAPEAANHIMEDDRRIMRSGETRTYEETLLAATDIEHTYLTTKLPFRDHQGKIIGIIGIARDITDLKQREEMLRESEERFRSVAQSANDAIISADGSGKIISWNKGAQAIFGYGEEEVMGKPIALLMPEQYREAHTRGLERMRSTGESRVIGKTLELYGLRKDGTEFPLELSLASWKREEVIFYGGIIRDITERKRAEDEIRILAKFPGENPDPVLRITKDGIILYANKASLHLLDLWGCKIGEPLPENWQQSVLGILNSGLSKEIEVECRERILALMITPIVEAGYVNIYGRDITERKQAEEQVRHLAYYDILTGLPNRLMFHDNTDRAITAARNENRSFAILAINLDRFKEINNTLGQDNGDILLQQAGERLCANIKTGQANAVAHMGGDGFAILMLNTDAEAATLTADKIKKIFEDSFVVSGIPIDISVSIGISLFPGHGEDADTLIRRAHIAMHRAKKTESGHCLYSLQHDQYSKDRLVLMGELRNAIVENQLFLLYQPKIDLKSGRTVGIEALCRWQHQKTGLIPPDKFISLAEESGLIKQLTFWVLKEALRQSRSWSQAGLEVSVAVNLSIKNLGTPLLLDQIKGLLSTWGVAPNRLRFEITESIIMADPELALEIITQLTLMGIRFSIDDFGTGYSSLRYLQRLPVDEIKIDKSFVMNMMEDENSMKIVRSTIELAHSLGLKVTAEGVESREVFDKLTALGCDAAQGYFISRPMLPSELAAWLSKQDMK